MRNKSSVLLGSSLSKVHQRLFLVHLRCHEILSGKLRSDLRPETGQGMFWKTRLHHVKQSDGEDSCLLTPGEGCCLDCFY